MPLLDRCVWPRLGFVRSDPGRGGGRRPGREELEAIEWAAVRVSVIFFFWGGGCCRVPARVLYRQKRLWVGGVSGMTSWESGVGGFKISR